MATPKDPKSDKPVFRQVTSEQLKSIRAWKAERAAQVVLAGRRSLPQIRVEVIQETGYPGDFPSLVAAELAAIGNLLIEKNAAYGNSALEPVRAFSKADPVEQIRVRIDDKISRIMRGHAAGEDCVHDLLGYLILLRIAAARQASGG